MSNKIDMKAFEHIEKVRVDASFDVRSKRQKLDEQYFTPGFVTNYIAENLVQLDHSYHNILDVAAGVGNIGAAVAISLIERVSAEVKIELTAVEIDSELHNKCNSLFYDIFDGLPIKLDVLEKNFFDYFKDSKEKRAKFKTIVMNPPYKKLLRKEYESLELECLGIEYSPNLYSLMMSCALELLHDDGALIAIVPRSFCSGSLFLQFRKKVVNKFKISFIHLFESRKKVFSFDGVQQETIIIKIQKKTHASYQSKISYGDDLYHAEVTSVDFSKIVFPHDNNHIIHIPHGSKDEAVLKNILSFNNNLASLGLKISTGKVVDFRNKEHLSHNKKGNGWLFCKENLEADFFSFPQKEFKNFISVNESTINKFLDCQCHVVMNRIYFKERKNVIVAQVIDSTSSTLIAIENHLNYISGRDGMMLDFKLALGIKCYLESELVSDYFRRFIGSTQINASDIKALPFPSKLQLIEAGEKGVFSHDE